MPKLNVQQNNQNIIQAFRNALAIGRLKGIIASDGNHNFSTSGSNPNLLDNAYFVGGGSQLGDGVFPINQKGQTSYTGTAASSIDRWKLSNGDASISLSASGMTIYTNGSGYGYGGQELETEFALDGTYTFSVLLADGTLYSTPTNQNLELPSGLLFYFANNKSVNWRNPANTTCETIAAVKLEKGTVSTLPNDPPPDFGEELRKCQRYLFIFQGGYIGWFYGDGANMRGIINTPAPFRTTPTISFTSNGFLSVATGAYVTSAGAFSVGSVNGTTLRVDGSLGGAVANGMYLLYLDNGQTLTLSAEL